MSGITSSVQAAFKDSTYSLDRAGNRDQVYDGSVWKNYTSDALNQYSQAEDLTVTNGPGEHRISAFDGVSFTYKNDGRLAMVSNGTTWTTFAYDALGRCVKRVRDNWDAKYSYYDGERELLECGSGGGAAFKNLYGKGIDEILRRIDTTNNWTFYHQQDHNGNVTELTNGSGVVVETFRYDAFGALNKTESGWKNPFLFTGRRYLSTFGIYEYRARAYHPRLGRFTSEDPKLFDAGDYNLFRYCHNDPLDMTDPMGLMSAPDLRTNPTVEQLAAAEKAAKALEHAYGWPGHGAINVGLAHSAAEQAFTAKVGITATKMAEAATGSGQVPYSVAVRRYQSTDNVAYSDPVAGVRNTKGGYTERIETGPEKFGYFRANPQLYDPGKWPLFVIGHTHPLGRSQNPGFSDLDRSTQKMLLKSLGQPVPFFKNNARWPGHVYDARTLGPNGWQVSQYGESGRLLSAPESD